MQVRRIGGHWCEFSCLEDSGSTNFSIFERDDLAMLGVNDAYPHWDMALPTATANGIVLRRYINLQVRVLSEGPGSEPIGPIFLEHCAVMPGFSQAGTRLSGMGLHRDLFVATAPDGAGFLYVAEKKNGIVRQLPVV